MQLDEVSMRHGRVFLTAMVCALFPLVMLYGCGSGDGGERQQTSISSFNGTFIGNITTQGEQASIETIHLSMTAGSPLDGTFFVTNDGDIGTISGDAKDELATFTGTRDGDCPASFSGSMILNGDNTLSINMGGTDCNGSFSSNGVLTKAEFIEIGGPFRASERGTVTCTFGGESETSDVSGTVITFLEQNGRNVRYAPPGVNADREGQIEGNNISFSGLFLIPLVEGVNFTQNIVTLEGKIINENLFILNGSGFANGTVDGVGFSCRGESTAEFKRHFDVVVAVLQGGPIQAPDWLPDWIFPQHPELDELANRIRSNRVAARVFDASPGGFGRSSQIESVKSWLSELNDDPYDPVPAILVGHSLGGDGAINVTYPNICSRILIDHWDPNLRDPNLSYPNNMLPVWNQRDYSARNAPNDGKVFSYLAESPDSFGLLGRRLTGSNVTEKPIIGTDHQSIVEHVVALKIFDDEIIRCSRR